MSYILEALKKAQAERVRGAVPGVDAHPVPTIVQHAPAGKWLWIAGGLAALSVGAVLLWPEKGTEQARLPSPPPMAMRADDNAGRNATPPAAPAPTAPAASPALAPVPMPVPAPTPAKPLRKLGEFSPSMGTARATVPAPDRIALLQELPVQIQRDIPPIAINGYIYASNPADRSVLVNNRVRREGDEVADGLTLEKLLPSEMVLNYRGYRYRINYKGG